MNTLLACGDCAHPAHPHPQMQRLHKSIQYRHLHIIPECDSQTHNSKNAGRSSPAVTASDLLGTLSMR